MALAITPTARVRLTRVKRFTSVEGVRDNQLIGYGVVQGLAGTGDSFQTVFSAQTLSNLLQRMGLSVPGTSLRVQNTAAVLVTATLPPFAQTGTRIDVTAAAAGDSKNLQGGLLLLTPLKASGRPDLRSGARASGGRAASAITKSGRIPKIRITPR